MRPLGFGRGSIITFLVGACCFLAALFLFSGLIGTLLGCAFFLTVPTGLALAFMGAVKGEEPRRYVVIGFVLNLLWFLLPVLLLLKSIWLYWGGPPIG